MGKSKSGRSLVLGVLVALAVFATRAEAGTIYSATGTSGGYTVSATADVTFGTNSVTIVLSNTTPFSHDAAQLLTAFDFNITGVSGVGSMTAASTPHGRTVASDGTYTDTAGAVNLLTAKNGSATWSLNHPSSYRLQFNPDAKYAILGAPSGSSSDYSGANGGIKANGGHSPFSALSATYTIGLTGVTSAAQLTDVVFLWGTDLGTRTPVVPLPSAVWGGLGLLGALGAVRATRRRRELG